MPCAGLTPTATSIVGGWHSSTISSPSDSLASSTHRQLATAAGLSQMTDGSAVAGHLEKNEPAHFDALTSLRWVFFNRGETVDHRWSGPIIDLGAPGSPITFRAFYPVRAFPDMDPCDVPRAYAALRRFSRLAGDPAYQMTYPFEPGDLVAFDNRRILHGRTAYEGAGHRHLRGCYLDHDDVRSSARVWYRAADHQPRSTTPTNGGVT